jgi:hypothetical protein
MAQKYIPGYQNDFTVNEFGGRIDHRIRVHNRYTGHTNIDGGSAYVSGNCNQLEVKFQANPLIKINDYKVFINSSRGRWKAYDWNRVPNDTWNVLFGAFALRDVATFSTGKMSHGEIVEVEAQVHYSEFGSEVEKIATYRMTKKVRNNFSVLADRTDERGRIDINSELFKDSTDFVRRVNGLMSGTGFRPVDPSSTFTFKGGKEAVSKSFREADWFLYTGHSGYDTLSRFFIGSPVDSSTIPRHWYPLYGASVLEQYSAPWDFTFRAKTYFSDGIRYDSRNRIMLQMYSSCNSITNPNLGPVNPDPLTAISSGYGGYPIMGVLSESEPKLDPRLYALGNWHTVLAGYCFTADDVAALVSMADNHGGGQQQVSAINDYLQLTRNQYVNRLGSKVLEEIMSGKRISEAVVAGNAAFKASWSEPSVRFDTNEDQIELRLFIQPISLRESESIHDPLVFFFQVPRRCTCLYCHLPSICYLASRIA